MKKIILLLAFLLISAGCTVTHKFMIGERFAVVVPERVAFCYEPSLDSKLFVPDRPEEFVIDGVECGMLTEGKKDDQCIFDLDEYNYPRNADFLFYKTKLESGKIGYLHSNYFFDHRFSRYLLPLGPQDQLRYFARRDDTFEVKTDYDTMWRVIVDSIDELGYVSAQMKKEDGYIETYIKNDGDTRSKLSARVSRLDEYMLVFVNARSENLLKTKEYKLWYDNAQRSIYVQRLLDKIRLKFFVLHRSADPKPQRANQVD
ncbi:MAG: hypothetical protein HY954_11595 [Deltaproteobacteria bacterium]|nr:hypothetical protein [Deltaproteobacteria bacterium]